MKRPPVRRHRKKLNPGWIGVDLDGTLARSVKWQGHGVIGEPVPAMVERVKAWLRQGRQVRIFTARVNEEGMPDGRAGKIEAIAPIEAWCLKHIGQVLPVTNIKDFTMTEMWDDRCVQVHRDTGIPVVPQN